MDEYVDMPDDELEAWRAQHPGRDRPRVVTGKAESVVAVDGGIPIASDD